ncbi:MAG: 2-oxoacid:ferredoxin oxidoreductase subunit beta [Phycisphaerales bacterium]|nr:2-oxoacid:ferredoxin oxidoreductase subunit beta [Phycisphaerales bacterium]
MPVELEVQSLSPKDYASDQDIRWCPGCGDYAILAQAKKVLADLKFSKENMVCVSGIGCSSRFPYYLDTYGIHSIHGRATAVATGLKIARPDLHVWVVTGDGDGLSIGGNHLLHVIRRNVGVTILLFNNRIYGLTKGQYSPTSEKGKKTKSTPGGSIDYPLQPLSVAIGAEATFVARSHDVNLKHLGQVLDRAARHKGTSFVEIYQNCNIFNDGAFEYTTSKETRDDTALILEHGRPMVFGKNRDKGIRLNGLHPEIVTLGNGIKEDDLLFHDERAPEPTLAYMLSRMYHPQFPEPIGVFRAVERPTYEEMVDDSVRSAIQTRGEGRLEDLFRSDDTWTVT